MTLQQTLAQKLPYKAYGAYGTLSELAKDYPGADFHIQLK